VNRPFPIRRLLSAPLAALLFGFGGHAGAQTPPTTFGTIVGNGLLCRDDIDNQYYYNYFAKALGAAYKHDGGAYWFKVTGATLWGVAVTEVMVSDDTSQFVFVGAVAETTPEKLEQAIIDQAGVHYAKIDTSPYPVREAKPASRIVYFDTKSKIYCAKFKPLPPTQPPAVRRQLPVR
jgi:hypothetical protein